MATITTILGTDSVSSSRIVINQNFDSLNTELGQIAGVLNTSANTLSLTGQILGGTLKSNNGTIDTFIVGTSTITANLEATFTENVILEKGLVLGIEGDSGSPITSLPAGGYESSVLILDGLTFLGTSIALDPAEIGQSITLIVEGAGAPSPVAVDTTNIAATTVEINENGSVTLVWSGTTFYVVSAMNTIVTY